jgi:hypothetical protein
MLKRRNSIPRQPNAISNEVRRAVKSQIDLFTENKFRAQSAFSTVDYTAAYVVNLTNIPQGDLRGERSGDRVTHISTRVALTLGYQGTVPNFYPITSRVLLVRWK